MDPLLLRPAEVAALLSTSRSRVYELIADGSIHTVRLGPSGSHRITRTELDRFISALSDKTDN